MLLAIGPKERTLRLPKICLGSWKMSIGVRSAPHLSCHALCFEELQQENHHNRQCLNQHHSSSSLADAFKYCCGIVTSSRMSVPFGPDHTFPFGGTWPATK